MPNLIKSFRIISILEAISYLVLLFIAMPLKYMFHQPELTRFTGSVHGALFILYVIGAFVMYKKLDWSIKTLLIAILCSVIPFGPFYVDKKFLPKRA